MADGVRRAFGVTTANLHWRPRAGSVIGGGPAAGCGFGSEVWCPAAAP